MPDSCYPLTFVPELPYSLAPNPKQSIIDIMVNRVHGYYSPRIIWVESVMVNEMTVWCCSGRWSVTAQVLATQPFFNLTKPSWRFLSGYGVIVKFTENAWMSASETYSFKTNSGLGTDHPLEIFVFIFLWAILDAVIHVDPICWVLRTILDTLIWSQWSRTQLTYSF